MIKITNGKEQFEIPKGAFPQFATQGYHIISDNGKPVKNEKVEPPKNEDNNTNAGDVPQEILDLEEKPIGQWSKDEVKTYAEYRGIDLKGTKNANEAKELIKQYLQ